MTHQRWTYGEPVGQEVSIADIQGNSRYEARNTNVQADFVYGCNINWGERKIAIYRASKAANVPQFFITGLALKADFDLE